MIYVTSILSIMLPFFTFPIVCIGFFMDKKHKFKYLLLLALILSMYAYTLDAKEGLDLSVYFGQMKSISHLSVSKFFISLKEISEPLFRILLYYIARIGDYHILPMITTFIIYSIYFFIIYDYYKENKFKDKYLTISVISILILFRYLYTISGIRNPLAISLFAIIFYYDVYKNRGTKVILLYIIPFLIHNSIILLVLIRIILLLIFNRKTKFKYIINITIVVLFLIFLNLLLNTDIFIDRGAYFSETYRSSFSLFENKGFLVQQILHILFISINYNNYKRTKDRKYLIINIFNIIIIVLGQIYFFIFDRYFQLMILFNILSMIDYMSINQVKFNIRICIIYVCLTFFLLSQIISITSADFLIEKNIFNNIPRIIYEVTRI